VLFFRSTSVLASNTPSMCTSVGLIDSTIPHSLSVLAPLVLTGIMVSCRKGGIDTSLLSKARQQLGGVSFGLL